MSLKDIMKQRTRKVQKQSIDKKNNFYEVKFSFEITEKRHITEIVKANDDEEALNKAIKQFSNRPAVYVHHRSDALWHDGNRFGIQNITRRIVKRDRKAIYLSDGQRSVIKKLQSQGAYLTINNYGRWFIRLPNDNDRAIEPSIATIDALFKKGFLIPLAALLSENELDAQKAIGSLGNLAKRFILNTQLLKELNIKIK